MSAKEIMSDANSKPAIQLNDVWVQYQLRNAHHHNLKRTLTNGLLRRKDEVEIITAVAGINLKINRGDRIGLTGPNGSGKSTLLAVMAGLLTPTRGTATTNGRVLALLGGPDQGLDPEQTGRENAVALGVKLGESASAMREQLDDIKEFSGLGGRFEHPVHTYSSGMQVRLRFTAITALKADILLVDEGIGAADAEFNARAEERLRGFYESAGTLIMASHSADLLRQHCTADIAMNMFKEVIVGAKFTNF
jgi:ABC-type polysaccharide/polyol phosphate transport system ATPase subunit